MIYTAGSHTNWEPLEKKIGKRILHPGSRGGKGYWDDQGQWQYGDRPSLSIPKADHSKHVSPEGQVMDILHEMGLKTEDDFNNQEPIQRIKAIKGAVMQVMNKRGYNDVEAQEAYNRVRAHIESRRSDYKAINWHTGGEEGYIDQRLKEYLNRRGVKPGHEADALVLIPKEKWEEVARDLFPPNSSLHSTSQNGRAKARKETIERIMELRYHLLYEESPPEPAPEQPALVDLGPEEEDYTGKDAAREFHALLSGTDRFNSTSRDTLPLDLAMDAEIGPAVMKLGHKARARLEPLYKHAFNLDATAALAAMAHSDTFGVPAEMKILQKIREEHGDPLTPDEITSYLQEHYDTKALHRIAQANNWLTIAHHLREAGVTDIADALDDAFKAPVRQALPDNTHPYRANVDPDSADKSEDLYRTWISEVDDLDYNVEPSQAAIQALADSYYQEEYDTALENLVEHYKETHQDEYQELWDDLAQEHMDNYMDLDDYLEQHNGDKEAAENAMREEASSQTESDADSQFEDRARDAMAERAAELAQEAAWEMASESASEESAEPRVKAKIDVMNALGARLEDDHDISDSDARRFHQFVGTYPDHEHADNAQGCSEAVAGLADVLVNAWAGSSDGHSALSNAMMVMAGRVFPGSPQWEEKPPHAGQEAWDQAQVFLENDHFQHVAEAFLRSMYDHTQQVLKEQGVTEVVIGRGIKTFPEEISNAIAAGTVALEAKGHSSGFITGTAQDVYTNPMSSWAFAQSGSSTISNFAGPGLIILATVPAERVLGSFRTGYGCYEEEEVVPIGGSGQVRWIAHHNASGRTDMLKQAAKGRHFMPPTVQRLPEGPNQRNYDPIHEPGVIYDADSGTVLQGELSDRQRAYNASALEHNKAADETAAQTRLRLSTLVSSLGVSPEDMPDDLFSTMENQMQTPHIYNTPGFKTHAAQYLSGASHGKITLAQAEELHTAMFPETQKSWSSRRLDSALSWSRDLAHRVARRND